MKNSDYVFLETREARMLAASWPEQFAEARGDAEKASNDFEKWRRIAGIEARMMPTTALIAAVNGLRWNGICLDDGTIDSDAAAFIKQAAYAAAGVQIRVGEIRVGTASVDEGSLYNRARYEGAEPLQLIRAVEDAARSTAKGFESGAMSDARRALCEWIERTRVAEITDPIGLALVKDRDACLVRNSELVDKLREAEAERDQLAESLRIARSDLENIRMIAREERRRGVTIVEPEPRQHPSDVGSSIPHAPFDPSGHASGCTAFACVSHCKQPRKVVASDSED